jgi:hypothetical protein
MFKNETSGDFGGHYRELFAHVCDEVQSPALGMLIPCPNARDAVGVGRDRRVVSFAFLLGSDAAASAASPLALSDDAATVCSGKGVRVTADPHRLNLFYVLGQLVGVAVRTHVPLRLMLPSLVWKPLVLQPLQRSDLANVDFACVEAMDKLQRIEDLGVTAETFDTLFDEVFCAHAADGSRRELRPFGSQTRLTFSNRVQYTRLLEEFRVQESACAVRALQEGLHAVLPSSLLPLFTWQELEALVCGREEADDPFMYMDSDEEKL